jgi:hypothetical protein
MRPALLIVAPAAVLALIASACTDGGGGNGPNDVEVASESPAVGATAPVGETGETSPETITARDFDPANFGDPTTVDNTYFPLTPGTRFVYEGQALDGKDTVERRVEMIVSDLTKEIAGVQTVVIWERDHTDGELEESEIAFFAQDDGGNVWLFGEYPEEYDGEEIVKTPAWIAGIGGARTGITIMGHPELGTPSYAQGFAPPPVNWNDRARVYQVGEQTCVPEACYQDVLVTEEFERTKPGAFQLKFYAPGVGTVRVGWRGKNEKEREELELVELTSLGAAELADVRDEVLAIEARAYELSPDVYGPTLPLEMPAP